MKVAKRFRWEAAHRLPWHDGECKYLHGHSYRMMVEVEGTPDERGMLIDFKHLKKVLKPLVEKWDHATLVADYDSDLKEAAEALDSKYFVLPYDSTAENLATFVADYLGQEAYEVLEEKSVTALRVKVWETETCYADIQRPLSAYAPDEEGAGAEEVAQEPALQAADR